MGNKTQIYDVIIIGCGPAGASAARELHKSGLSVLIIDKLKLPRKKLCAGGLTPEAFRFINEHFGSIPEDLFPTPRQWKGLRIKFGIQTPVYEFVEMNRHSKDDCHSDSIPEYPQNTICVWRDSLDNWLVKTAGAEVKDGLGFIGFERNGREEIKVCVSDTKAQVKHRFSCKFLIGADGINSKVRKLLYPSFDSNVSLFRVYEEWHRGNVKLDNSWYYMFSDPSFGDIFAGFYSRDEILILTLVLSEKKPIRKAYKAFENYLKLAYGFHSTNRIKSWGCSVNNMGAKGQFIYGESRVALVGDAAGFTGLCGEGISGALISGKHAAKSICNEFNNPDAMLSAYVSGTCQLRERIKKEHETGSILYGDSYKFYSS